MTRRYLTALTLLLFGWMAAYAQDANLSWSKHLKMADELYAKAEYADAAGHYEMAWKQKTKKKELINKAAECYWTIRNYRKAAEAWSNIKDDNKDFPLVTLRYARALKQDGQYDAAGRTLVNFLNGYDGKDKAIVAEIVQNEIKGCELGLQGQRNPRADVQIAHLGGNINTLEMEFAPIAFSDEVMYFSSTMGKKARIYRSLKENGEWAKATVPTTFPVMENEHFCNGALSPDNGRFYFTICESAETWGALTTRCDIYFIKKTDTGWSAPTKLANGINGAKSTSTHPNVVHQDGKEILYFASNREGGQGGMDLWSASRSLSNEAFSAPVNLGPKINTLGDEVTPFYYVPERKLFFSSEGHATVGGFDIFAAQGSGETWTKPENLGMPLSSSADDLYYVLNPSGKTGFLVSNRLFGTEKITTQHEDIFEVTLDPTAAPVASNSPTETIADPAPVVENQASGQSGKGHIASGTIYDKKTGAALEEITVSLYALEGSKDQLIANKVFQNGTYAFPLEAQKEYKIQIQSDGYLPEAFVVRTEDPDQMDVGRSIYLEPYQDEETETPVESNPEVAAPVVQNTYQKPDPVTETSYTADTQTSSTTAFTTSTDGIKYTTRGISRHDSYEIITAAPRHVGTYYKVQLIAIKTFDENQSRYDQVKGLARFDTEYIVRKKVTRVLLADFFSEEEAMSMMRQAKSNGFPDAFVVKYEDGERVGMWRR